MVGEGRGGELEKPKWQQAQVLSHCSVSSGWAEQPLENGNDPRKHAEG